MARRRLNPHCTCRKSGAYLSRGTAEAARDRAGSGDPLLNELYRPRRVVRCPVKSGVWHLTSSDGKPWKHGKRRANGNEGQRGKKKKGR